MNVFISVFYCMLCIDQSLNLYHNAFSIHMVELLSLGYNTFHFKYLAFNSLELELSPFASLMCNIYHIQEVKSEMREV